MSWTLVDSGSAAASDPDTATVTINTIGADLIVVIVGWFADLGGTSEPTLTDDEANTWIDLEAQISNDCGLKFSYCIAPDTHAAHGFDVSGIGTYPMVAVAAWDATGTVTIAGFNGNFNSVNGTTGQPGAVSPVGPNANGSLIVTGLCTTDESHDINGLFAVLEDVDVVPAVTMGGALASMVQAIAGSVNPTWSWLSGSNYASSIAAFVEDPPLGETFRNRLGGGRVLRA